MWIKNFKCFIKKKKNYPIISYLDFDYFYFSIFVVNCWNLRTQNKKDCESVYILSGKMDFVLN